MKVIRMLSLVITLTLEFTNLRLAGSLWSFDSSLVADNLLFLLGTTKK